MSHDLLTCVHDKLNCFEFELIFQFGSFFHCFVVCLVVVDFVVVWVWFFLFVLMSMGIMFAH